MIANEYQYNLTRKRAAQFEQTLEELDNRPTGEASSLSSLLLKAERDALQSQLDSLREEIAEYEALRSGRRRTFTLESFADLPNALIQARIAAGLTQKQLAQRLGLKEQQIQRYEATGYASANFKRIAAVMDALGLQLRDECTLTGRTT
jgi:ribosome-binding protein aMBF1 (putative translation factor)